MKKLFNITNILIFIIIITLIIIVSLIIHTKNIYNNKINKLEESINVIQEDIELIFNNTQSNTEELKVLIEKHNNCCGLANKKYGTSSFIASDGWIYEYEYNQNKDINEIYPYSNDLDELSNNLIKSAKKTKNRVTEKELLLLNTYITKIEKENLIDKYFCKQGLEDGSEYSTNVYIYQENILIEIDKEECDTYYTSPSIEKILEIINKYL